MKKAIRARVIGIAENGTAGISAVVFAAGIIVLVALLVAAFLPAFAGGGASGLESATGSSFSLGSGTADAALGLISATRSSSEWRSVWRSLVFSVKQAFCSTLLALVIGLPAAFFVARRRFAGSRLLRAFSAVPLCIPPILVALGYVQAFGMNGIANRILMKITGSTEPPLSFLYSFTGVVIAHGFYDFPIIMRTVADSWASLNQDEYDAARVCGARPSRVFRTVTLPQLAPAIASGAAIVFLYCFFSFVIVLLFISTGGTSLEVEIYHAARNTLNFQHASRLALVETGAALIMLVLYIMPGRAGRRSVSVSRPLEKKKMRGILEYASLIILLASIIAFFVLPLGAIVARGSVSFGALFSRSGFFTALKNTLLTSVCTGLLSVLLATVFTVISHVADPNKKRLSLQILPLIPMAVSSVVLSYGLMRLFPGSSSPLQLIVAESLLYWPFAQQQINRAMDRIPQQVEQAALILSPRPFTHMFRVLLPLSRRGILSGFAFCMAMSVGDASIPLVLSLPRFDTLALYTYRLSGAYRFSEACACGFLLLITGIALFLLADSGFRPRNRGPLKAKSACAARPAVKANNHGENNGVHHD